MVNYKEIEEKVKNKSSNTVLVAVSKTKPIELILEAYDQGARIFGENRVQELVAKFSENKKEDMKVYLIGQLQSNKVKKAVMYADRIESVDSISLLDKINVEAGKINKKIEILLEVNSSFEEQKSGFRTRDEVISASDDEIATAILTLIEQQKLISEGARAVSVAAAIFNKVPIKGKKVACVVSGGNIDVNILSRVINRGLLTSGRLTDLTIELLDKPGQLREVSTIIAEHGANVIRVSHKQGGKGTDINGCFLNVTMETKNHQHLEEIKQAFEKAGYKIKENK